MGMERYGVEIGAFSDEIYETLGGDGRKALGQIRRRMGDEAFVSAGYRLAEEAMDYLARPVARQGVVLRRCASDADRLIVLAVARCLAISAAIQIDAAESISYVQGSSYRKAAAEVASIALRAGPPISADGMASPYW
jgi:hypothetical protein